MLNTYNLNENKTKKNEPDNGQSMLRPNPML